METVKNKYKEQTINVYRKSFLLLFLADRSLMAINVASHGSYKSMFWFVYYGCILWQFMMDERMFTGQFEFYSVYEA